MASTAIIAVYVFALGMVCVYGLHRYQLVYLYYKHRKNKPQVDRRFDELPRITIQLPMYNERYVARRIIEHACALEYPRELIQVQVLDDSTDETVHIAEQTVADLKALGHDIVYLHRDSRTGYKAGALEAGMASATGEFICIFDADFQPPPDILRDAVHYFMDPGVGMVQLRWDHINRDESLLTKTQAIMLDGHFVMEHGARNRSGRFMSFNGTAGLWRASCVREAGGWEHDTLTEDLDLSYRAQMKGWKFVFDPDIVTPAELPPDIQGFKDQQYRWAKGGAQTCRKLLGRILGSRLPWKVKSEAFFHLTSCTVYLYMIVLTLLLYPVLWISIGQGKAPTMITVLIDLSLFMVATCSASSFYACSQRELFRSWSDSLKYLPFLMSLGIGISLNNARAAVSGFLGRQSEFVRTPKFGTDEAAEGSWKKRMTYARKRKSRIQPLLELGMGIYLTACTILCLEAHWITIGLPFLVLFGVGYFYMGINSLLSDRLRASAIDSSITAGVQPAAATQEPVVSSGRAQA